ncbi:MAG: YIP1 family protein [Bacteroidota bacterium]
MITCTVCGAENDALAVVCTSCKSYLQGKVDTLNLFETLWGLMETPEKTFHRIALARYKNYTILLNSLFGCALVFGVIWSKTLGSAFANLATLLGTGIVLGPPAGVIVAALLAVFARGAGRAMGGHGTIRNVYAVIAYAAAPVAYSLVLVFPVEIAVFGMYLFGNNPSPMVINPALYIVLIGLDGAAVIWSWFLLGVGVRVALALSKGKGYVVSTAMVTLVAAVTFALQAL